MSKKKIHINGIVDGIAEINEANGRTKLVAFDYESTSALLRALKGDHITTREAFLIKCIIIQFEQIKKELSV